MSRPLPHPRADDAWIPADPAPDPPLPVLLEVAGVLALLVVAVIGAAVSVLLTPWRIGATLVPLAVVVAVVLNVVVPSTTHRLSGSRSVAALPVVAFFLAGWAMSIGPGGDVLLAGGSDTQTAISYATLLLGVLAGAVTVARTR